jgi:hypothetical protein
MTALATGRGSARGRLRHVLRPALVVALLCVAYLGFIYGRYERNDSPWFEFVRPTPAGSAGYDGQFAYCIALDPAFAAPCLDVPAYRYQRILHPMLARLLGGSDAIRIIQALLAVNLLMLVIGTGVLEALLTELHVSRWYALTYGLFGGVFFAVRVTTAEPLAYGLLLMALWAGAHERWGWHALWLGLAAFAKEITLITAAGYVLYFLLHRRWWAALRLSALTVGAFAIWQVVLYRWFGSFGVGSGGALATPFELVPFMGVWRIGLEAGVGAFLRFGALLLPFAIAPTVWGLWHSGRDILKQRWHPYAFILLTNAAIMLSVPFSTYREPLGITRFMPGLVIALVLFAALRRQRRALLYSTLWIVWGIMLWG